MKNQKKTNIPMKDKGDNAIFINMNKFIQDPIMVINKYKDYVLNGEDNKLPYHIIDYYRNVGIHRAIVDKKKRMFLGKGVAIDSEENSSEYKATESFLNEINPFENIDSLMDKYALDIMLNKGSFFQVIWNAKNQIKEVYHMPFEKMRSGKKDIYGQVHEFYYNSSDEYNKQWTSGTMISNEYIHTFPAFSTTLDKDKAQILYIKEYEPGNGNYYSLADYIASLKDLDTLKGISDLNNSNVHNGMSPGVIIKFTGPEPSKEDKDKIVKNIKAKYQNTENSGRPLVFFMEDGQDIKIETPDKNDNVDMYKALTEQVIENILVSHQIPRVTAGLKVAGSLGSSKEALENLEIVRSNYIQPLQSFFMDKFNIIMQINGLANIKLIAPSPSLSKYTIQEQLLILTQDEIRERHGESPLNNNTKTDING